MRAFMVKHRQGMVSWSDRGRRHVVGRGQRSDAWGNSLRSAGYPLNQVDLVLSAYRQPDHVGGLTPKTGQRVGPKTPRSLSRKAGSDLVGEEKYYEEKE